MRRWYQHWGATAEEITRAMRGDAEVPRATYDTTLAVTVKAPAAAVWPWLLPNDIVERHHVHVAAPAEVTLQVATEMNLQQSAIARTIFKAREWVMGSRQVRDQATGSFLSQMRAIGWGVLADVPGREIVMGAVTQPWLADVVFRPLPADEFAAFREPGFVKIAWTLRADPIGAAESIFRTETRALPTDPTARAKFRQYWSLASPGIIVIRWVLLGPLKAEAERRARRRST